VTGGAGFIGSHLVDRLVAAGHQVVVVDNLSTGRRENLNPKARFLELDIRDPELIGVVRSEKPDSLFHWAAQIDVRKSLEDPRYDAEVNIVGTLNVIQAALAGNVRRLVFASTGGALYGEAEAKPFTEESPAAPISAYGIAKYAGELYLNGFSRSHSLPFVALRFANVYGPRQDPRGEAGVVAIFCRQLLRGETPVLYGYGDMVRDYVYVADVVEASIAALEPAKHTVYNVGTGVPTSVSQLFEHLREISGNPIDPERAEARPGELFRSFLDSGRLRADFGWEAKTPLREGLATTFEWFKEYFETR
jgi:UDP-glucose 4-epimerase